MQASGGGAWDEAAAAAARAAERADRFTPQSVLRPSSASADGESRIPAGYDKKKHDGVMPTKEILGKFIAQKAGALVSSQLEEVFGYLSPPNMSKSEPVPCFFCAPTTQCACLYGCSVT